ncbi:MAG: allantoicase [Elusimicrobiota bacterium]|nr:MAG: allantoicase [Elusimicrobiota bacterium]
MDFTQLIDLASARVGGKALRTNDDFFAPMGNLVKPEAPVWIADKYTAKGKWMDGWESRRRRTPGYDWCELKLGLRGVIKGVNVQTSFFTGNYPSHASLDAKDGKDAWVEILPKTALKGNSDNLLPVKSDRAWDHVRLNIFPDGGVARLRVYGEVTPDWTKVPKKALVDLVSVEYGGLPLLASDVHYSHPQNLIMPGRSKNMGDGWETKRRRGPGHDWAILKLGAPGQLRKIEVDTNFFKGNYPDSCMLEGVHKPGATGAELADEFTSWTPILPQTKLSAHKRHFFSKELAAHGPVTHVRLSMFPDGGISRLRLLGVRA